MRNICFLSSVSRVSIGLALLLILAPALFGQGYSNSISGRVTGVEGRPVADLYVELLDEFSRTIARKKIAGGGFYEFSGLSAGRFVVRVLTSGSDYEEQENSVQIDSYSPNMRTNEQMDFRLRVRKSAQSAQGGAPASIFVQDVPPEAKTAYDKAIMDLDAGRVDTALEGLKRAIELFPKYYLALERLGVEYLRKDNALTDQAAEILFNAATEVNPRGYASWFGLAYSLNKQNEYSRALPAILKAVELQPTALDAALLSGALLRHNRKYDEAEKQLLKAQELADKPSPQIHWELALLYGNHMKRYKDAARELRSFLKLNPNAKEADKIEKLIAEFENKAKTK